MSQLRAILDELAVVLRSRGREGRDRRKTRPRGRGIEGRLRAFITVRRLSPFERLDQRFRRNAKVAMQPLDHGVRQRAPAAARAAELALHLGGRAPVRLHHITSSQRRSSKTDASDLIS